MDYLDFFGLNQEPFSMAPVGKFYFNSAQHSRALVRLMYAVDTMKGLAVLIGDIGTGKTTLARRMLESLPDEEYESALLVIIHSGITADWLLERIALQLGVKDPAKEKLALLSQLYKRLVELHNLKKKAVVLIDEAQMLQSRAIMEEFRGLLNLEMPEKKLITFVFFGLPDIEESLKLDPPLAQRAALKYTLEPFNEESTGSYIQHRLRLAGTQDEIFDAEAITEVHRYSRGIPRLINTICDNALFEGYLLKLKKIDVNLVTNVVSDLGLGGDDSTMGLEEELPRFGTVSREKTPPPRPRGSTPPPMQRPKGSTPPPMPPRPQVKSATPPPKAPTPPPAPPQPAASNGEVDGVLDEFDAMMDDNRAPQKAAAPAPEKAPAQNEGGDADLDSMFDDLEKK